MRLPSASAYTAAALPSQFFFAIHDTFYTRACLVCRAQNHLSASLRPNEEDQVYVLSQPRCRAVIIRSVTYVDDLVERLRPSLNLINQEVIQLLALAHIGTAPDCAGVLRAVGVDPPAKLEQT